jgi:hypothetical protein
MPTGRGAARACVCGRRWGCACGFTRKIPSSGPSAVCGIYFVLAQAGAVKPAAGGRCDVVAQGWPALVSMSCRVEWGKRRERKGSSFVLRCTLTALGTIRGSRSASWQVLVARSSRSVVWAAVLCTVAINVVLLNYKAIEAEDGEAFENSIQLRPTGLDNMLTILGWLHCGLAAMQLLVFFFLQVGSAGCGILTHGRSLPMCAEGRRGAIATEAVERDPGHGLWSKGAAAD